MKFQFRGSRSFDPEKLAMYLYTNDFYHRWIVNDPDKNEPLRFVKRYLELSTPDEMVAAVEDARQYQNHADVVMRDIAFNIGVGATEVLVKRMHKAYYAMNGSG